MKYSIVTLGYIQWILYIQEHDSHDEIETEAELDQIHKPLRRYDPSRLSTGSGSSGRSRTRSKNRSRDSDREHRDHGGRSSPAIHRHSLMRKTSNGSQEVILKHLFQYFFLQYIIL